MKKILITGCSSGFGFLAAKAFSARGDQVIATMRNPEGKHLKPADDLRAAGILVIDMDVTSDASVTAAGERVIAAMGAPDVVINNAGQMYVGVTEAFTSEELRSNWM